MSIENIQPKPARILVYLMVQEHQGNTWYRIFWTEARAFQEVKKVMRQIIEAERMADTTTASAHKALSRIETELAENNMRSAMDFWENYWDGMAHFYVIQQDLVLE